MTLIKVSQLTGVALDYAVALCSGTVANLMSDGICFHFELDGKSKVLSSGWADSMMWCPSTKWSQGGPIIEREKITIDPFDDSPNWCATIPGYMYRVYGQTPLIAAMRCYVASKVWETIEIPDQLI